MANGSRPNVRTRQTLIRSIVVGIAATLTGLGSLAIMVYAMGISPQVASWPSLLLGAAVQFLGSRMWAFSARRGSLRRQITGFTLVEIVTLALNGGIYHALIEYGPSRADWNLWPMGARLVTESAVFLGWSYPMWRVVFRTQETDTMAAGEWVESGAVDSRDGKGSSISHRAPKTSTSSAGLTSPSRAPSTSPAHSNPTQENESPRHRP